MEGLSRLSKKCRKCPYVVPCDHKQMEALAYLNEASQPAMADAAAPVLRETVTVYIQGNPTIVYKDEIEREIYKSLHTGLGLQFGG